MGVGHGHETCTLSTGEIKWGEGWVSHNEKGTPRHAILGRIDWQCLPQKAEILRVARKLRGAHLVIEVT